MSASPAPSEKPAADHLDPATEAQELLNSIAEDETPQLIAWRGGFHWHARGCYREKPAREVRDLLIRFLNSRYSNVTVTATNNVYDQLRALSMVVSGIKPPTWRWAKPHDWPADKVIAARNGIVNLELLASRQKCIVPNTPRLFVQSALDFDVDPSAPPPARWLEFLDSLWGTETDNITALQELFGYMVVGGTWLQKIFALIGPPRSGKGTIARVMRGLVGLENCCGPTLAGMGTNFGLWPLMGKSLATIADARLSGRTDQAIVVERLLSISGEDALTVDRKMLEPVTCTLPTRIVLLTNELPRLGDSSGAMAKRIVLWRFSRSFYGQENHNLTDELLPELPSILLWAIEGWKRLKERGHMIQPKSGRDMILDLEDLGSPVSAFVREECIIEPEMQVSVAHIYSAWKKWAESKGHRVGSEQGFGRNLTAAFPGLERTQPRDADGSRYRAYQGIGLRTFETGGF